MKCTDWKELLKHFNECEDEECPICGIIIWDHNDPMHFHHDGCPSCHNENEFERGITYQKLKESYLQYMMFTFVGLLGGTFAILYRGYWYGFFLLVFGLFSLYRTIQTHREYKNMGTKVLCLS